MLVFVLFMVAQAIRPGDYHEKAQQLELERATINANWMEQNWAKISKKTLQQITLPGTHDSGSYNLTDDLSGIPEWLEVMIKIADFLDIPVGKIIDGWGKSQTLNFFDQFSYGIRYVDVRVIYDSRRHIWRTHHGVILGSPLRELLEDTARFIKLNPKEVLVLELSHGTETPGDSLQKYADLITTILGKHLCPPSLGFVPLDEMVSRGYNVLLTSTIGPVPNAWDGDTIVNSYANSDKLSKMEAYNNQQVKWWSKQRGNISGLFKMSWTLTPNVETIINMIFPGNPRTLIELASLANPALPGWFNNVTNFTYPILGNILIIDDAINSQILDVVKQAI